MSFSPFEHKIHNLMTENSIPSGSRLLVALSGGMDSVCLLVVLNSLAKLHSFSISAAFVHQGGESEYRQKAAKFSENFCLAQNVPFFLLHNSSLQIDESEAGLREVRYELLRRKKEEIGFDYLVLAHHLDDLLETRLIRLIRGTGAQGLESMKVLDGDLLRPMLYISRKDLIDFASQNKLLWVEDPSNLSTQYLRNWVRNEWLPLLEERSRGSVSAFAQSLQNISEELHSRSNSYELVLKSDGSLFLPTFWTLSVAEQGAVIAKYLLSHNVQDFTRNHIKEIIKHLDSSPNVHSFKVAGLHWEVNATQLSASKLK